MTLMPAADASLATDPALLAAAAAGLTGALTFFVDDESVTFRALHGVVSAAERPADDAADADDAAVVVRLSRSAWDDLVNQLRTPINLLLSDDIAFERGDFNHLAHWEVALRYLMTGVPPYVPERTDLRGRDPRATMTLDDSDEDLLEQLQTMGYLHIKGVFSPDEIAAANAEIDRLAAEAVQGDDTSWWVTDEHDEERLCRLVYATQRSALLLGMENDPRVERLGRLTDPTLRQAPDRMEGTAVLFKIPGRTKGLSNIPWHQDCGMGGHAIFCPSTAIGIQLTGSSPETGNLLVVPGSHGQLLPADWERRIDAPVVEVNTDPGDVTVHIQDVMHASPAPTATGGRRTMYTTFYPAKLWDHIGPGQAFNDLVRNRTKEVGALA